MTGRRAAVLLGWAAFLGACDSGPPPVGSLVAVGAADLTGVVGKALTVQVRVDDRSGRILEKYPVRLTAAPGSGSVTPAEISTDASGTVTVQWTLGTTAGAQSMTASAGDQSLTLNATAQPDVPALLAAGAGAGQTGQVGEPLATMPVVRVRDQYQNGVPNVEVTLRVATGGGALATATARSNASGDVSVAWTLGPTIGEQAVTAEVAGITPLRITANALPGPPARVALVSGGGQTGTVGKPMPNPVVVEVKDRFGNLAMGGRVDFRGDGAVSPTPGAAAADGRATVTWTLGTKAGTQAVRAIAGTSDSVSVTGTANAGPPKTAAKVRGDAQRGFAGGVLADSVTVVVKDEYDNPVPGVEVAFAVTGGAGSGTPASRTTGANGQASAAWRLGTAVGANALEARVTGLSALAFAATATSGPPSSMVPVSGDGQSARVATELPQAVVVRVRDAFGNAVQGAVVELAAGGGGTVSPGTVVTDTTGAASFRWTLGTGAGTQAVTARAGSATRFLSATGLPGPVQSLTKSEGDLQTATVNRPVAVAPSVVARDAYGNGVSGVPVTFTVAARGGSITGASQTTDASGVARVGSWTLGPSVGRNALSASASGLASVEFTAEGLVPDVTYSIELVWVGAQAPSAAAQSAVSSAISRWESVIAGDLSNVTFSLTAGACGVAHPAYPNRVVDDLLIFAEVAPIDGAGQILAQAGPCLIRSSNGTTLVGAIRVDADDAARPDIAAVLAHEIGHVIGFGTSDGWYGHLITNIPGDPYFNGAAARARYSAAGGHATNTVPVEAGGGAGTANSHWRESDMGRELMTGYINSGANLLSAITIGAMSDMGYVVNYGAAESYAVGPSAPDLNPESPVELPDDVLRIPIVVVPDSPSPR